MSDQRIKIRDWDSHFEADRSRQWKKLSWVPVPNKQGLGYKKIMAQKDGAAIFGCWNALIQQASKCNPRGDLSKYSIEDLSINTMISIDVLKKAINFITQHLDWIEVIGNLDINVNENDISVSDPPVVSSILCSSLLSSSITDRENKFIESVNELTEYPQPMRDDFIRYWTEKNPSGKKMKFEMQKTFEISKRLVTWNKNNFGNVPKQTTLIPKFQQQAKGKYGGH